METMLDKKNAAALYIKQAAEDRKNLWKPILYLLLVTTGVGFLLGLVVGLIFGDKSLFGELLIQLLSFAISLYSVRYLLNLVDDKKKSFTDTFKQITGRQWLYALVAYILMNILIGLGLVLLIVPGLIVAYMLMMVLPISSESIVKPIDALKQSRALTNGYKMKLFTVGLSTTLHYIAIPILMLLVILLSTTFAWPMFVTVLAIVVAVVFSIYAQFALATLLPRMYRDLQAIKSQLTE